MAKRRKAFRMACLEAMSMGIVPIVSSAGALNEMVNDEINGLFIGDPKNMEKKLSDGIIRAINIRKEKYISMRNSAIKTAREKYSIDKIIDNIMPIYNSIILSKAEF